MSTLQNLHSSNGWQHAEQQRLADVELSAKQRLNDEVIERYMFICALNETADT
jgi:hypothetical protein